MVWDGLGWFGIIRPFVRAMMNSFAGESFDNETLNDALFLSLFFPFLQDANYSSLSNADRFSRVYTRTCFSNVYIPFLSFSLSFVDSIERGAASLVDDLDRAIVSAAGFAGTYGHCRCIASEMSAFSCFRS